MSMQTPEQQAPPMPLSTERNDQRVASNRFPWGKTRAGPPIGFQAIGLYLEERTSHVGSPA